MTVYMTVNHIIQSRTVAPHVGAWIETQGVENCKRYIRRSPCGSVD